MGVCLFFWVVSRVFWGFVWFLILVLLVWFSFFCFVAGFFVVMREAA